MRERLIELILACDMENEVLVCFKERPKNRQAAEIIADHLLANGVIVPPCKVGDTVWVYNQSKNNIYKNTVFCIKIIGTSKYKNTIKVEYKNALGESSCRRYTWAQIGKQVFLTEEEAVEALAEYLRKGATDDQN